ncbi:hypothetical protein ABEB36_015503 [Hypothenemus hampei]|uniref:Uncharacterized protein n=1 Tax=Hypothenemus hampei TaxID=57062 RepID=A0ABD1DZL8_HYPHA
MQEEFLQTLSESEKALTKSFKRVVTCGKGSKPVPILFSQPMQFEEVLLNTRNLYVSNENKYLFANPNTLNRYLSGYHCVKKLSERSGVSDVKLFTSTRLRKQIATILQVLNVIDNEFEQFASFMGHTKKTHANYNRAYIMRCKSEYCRLSQDIYQTAKVSKLLLAINSGKGHKYKGKTLDDIEISDDLCTDDEQNDDQTDRINPCETACANEKTDIDLEINSQSFHSKKISSCTPSGVPTAFEARGENFPEAPLLGSS